MFSIIKAIPKIRRGGIRMVSLSNMQREITILSEGIFEIASILKRNYGCNDPNFRKTFSDILIQSGNENLNIIINSIVDSIVTEL